MIHVLEYLKEHEVENLRNYKLSKISPIRIGGNADLIAFPKSIHEVIDLINLFEKRGIPYKILGRASNVLFCDLGYNGVIISQKHLTGINIIDNLITAEAGTALSAVIRVAAEHSLGGMEALSGIPATLGGAVHNNAGAFGSEISDFICNATLYNIPLKQVITLDANDMCFRYRDSLLSSGDFILLSAKLAFAPMEREVINSRMRTFSERRRATQPSEPSLGSVFKRNGDISIARLIDSLGMKGERIGDAEISKKHAGFIINRGNASSHDFINLIEYIKMRVCRRYGFIPEEEIEILR